eukprot:4790266-Lingulodinium_polyedra.AAC.1
MHVHVTTGPSASPEDSTPSRAAAASSSGLVTQARSTHMPAINPRGSFRPPAASSSSCTAEAPPPVGTPISNT